MPRRNRYIAVVGGIALAIATLGLGIAAVVGFDLFTKDGGCPEGTVPSYHPGECRELLPIETDTTFPWAEQQVEAKEFFRQFQKNVAADKRQEVSSMMMYPLRVNFYTDPKPADYRFINSPEELLYTYENVFHESVKDYISNFNADEVWGNDYFLQTGSGQIGIYCTTIGECPNCTFDFKVKIIHSNSVYRDTIEDEFGNPRP